MSNLTTYIEARKTLASLCCPTEDYFATGLDSLDALDRYSLRTHEAAGLLSLSSAEFDEIMAESRPDPTPGIA